MPELNKALPRETTHTNNFDFVVSHYANISEAQKFLERHKSIVEAPPPPPPPPQKKKKKKKKQKKTRVCNPMKRQYHPGKDKKQYEHLLRIQKGSTAETLFGVTKDVNSSNTHWGHIRCQQYEHSLKTHKISTV